MLVKHLVKIKRKEGKKLFLTLSRRKKEKDSGFTVGQDR